MGRKVQAGLTIEKQEKQGCEEEKQVTLADGFELNIEELKSKMNQL